MEWEYQSQVLCDLIHMLKPMGRLILLEGSQQGADELNKLRAAWGLEPIPIKWHNRFLDDDALLKFMKSNNCKLIAHAGLGTYYMLTRGIRPALDTELGWESDFNRLAATREMEHLLGFGTNFSRLKLWVFQNER